MTEQLSLHFMAAYAYKIELDLEIDIGLKYHLQNVGWLFQIVSGSFQNSDTLFVRKDQLRGKRPMFIKNPGIVLGTYDTGFNSQSNPEGTL